VSYDNFSVDVLRNLPLAVADRGEEKLCPSSEWSAIALQASAMLS